MTRDEIVAKVRELHLPDGSYVVFGSGPMAAHGLREAADIDLFVTSEILERFKKAGWQQKVKGDDDRPYVMGDFEAHDNWDFSSHKPKLHELIKTATEYGGVAFASLDEVRKWKQSSGRPKDLTDIELIDEYSLAK